MIGQLDFYWQAHLWPRLTGLTDDGYFWEPVAGCGSLRPEGTGRWRMEKPGVADGPLTTIAWRMTHMSVEVFESRYRAFFGGEGPDQWAPGRRLLEEGELAAPLGPKGADFAGAPLAELVLHLNREVMHHGGEVCLLRDLYRDLAGADAKRTV